MQKTQKLRASILLFWISIYVWLIAKEGWTWAVDWSQALLFALLYCLGNWKYGIYLLLYFCLCDLSLQNNYLHNQNENFPFLLAFVCFHNPLPYKCLLRGWLWLSYFLVVSSWFELEGWGNRATRVPFDGPSLATGITIKKYPSVLACCQGVYKLPTPC